MTRTYITGKIVKHYSPIILFDSDSNEKLYLTCELYILNINFLKLNKAELLKVNKKEHIDAEYLFFPINMVDKLQITRFKEISSLPELFKAKSLSKYNGIFVPLKHLDKSYFSSFYSLADYLKANKFIINKLFKARKVSTVFDAVLSSVIFGKM